MSASDGKGRLFGYPDLAEVLRLEPSGSDEFTAIAPRGSTERLFGGQVVAQGLKAAICTTAEPFRPNALHAAFIRGGRPDVPVRFSVERTGEGRTFLRRQVTARQGSEIILTLAASFHVGEDGIDWQPPFDVGPHPDRVTLHRSPLSESTISECFHIGAVNPVRPDGLAAHHPTWVKAIDPIDPTDWAEHTCALAYLSDFGLAMTARWTLPDPPSWSSTSLDHAVWLHRPVIADDWQLISAEPVSRRGGRTLVRATIHDVAGRLVASIEQEVLIRRSEAP